MEEKFTDAKTFLEAASQEAATGKLVVSAAFKKRYGRVFTRLAKLIFEDAVAGNDDMLADFCATQRLIIGLMAQDIVDQARYGRRIDR